MHRFVIFLFVLWAHPFAGADESLEVLWWNTACGRTAPQHFSQSLKNLAAADYDIMILAETPESCIPVEIYNLIGKNFPYQLRLEYVEGYRGFLVLSRLPFQGFWVELAPYDKSWPIELGKEYDREWQKRMGQSLSLSRRLYELHLEKNGQKYALFFTHLINPWNAIKAQVKGWAKFVTLQRLADEMTHGEDNPLVYQAANLNSWVTGRQNQLLPGTKSVIVGDFNAPHSVVPKNTFLLGQRKQWPAAKAYEVLRQGLTDITESSHYSIPTKLSRKKYPKPEFRVDHALVFADQEINARAQILYGYEGSDHYPLHVEIKP